MSIRPMRFVGAALISAAAILVWLAVSAPPPASGAPAAAPILVNSPADLPDIHPGEGVCQTALDNQVCTLRGAIQEADAHPDADTIQLQANTTYVLDQVDPGHLDDDALKGDLDIDNTVTLLGAGPASTIIDGNGAVLSERVVDIITGTVVISGVTVENGRETNFGGGIYNGGQLTVDNTWVLSNSVSGLNDWGGGMVSFGTLTVTHSLIRGNQTGDHNPYGGGIANNGPNTLAVFDSLISDNVTSGTILAEGGGLYNPSLVVESTISGNSGRLGGGVYTPGNPLSIINSTISGNDSTINGGGLFVDSGQSQLFNVTIAGNTANSDFSGSAAGGGVFAAGGATVDLSNSILAGNVVIKVPGPSVQASDCAGVLTSTGNNLVQTDNCTINGAYLHTNALLGPLQANGGPTPTRALLSGSPAIDTGALGGCTDNLGAPILTDQRGAPRPANGAGANRCDLGAFEFQRLLALPLLMR